jgi:hypothetical protein
MIRAMLLEVTEFLRRHLPAGPALHDGNTHHQFPSLAARYYKHSACESRVPLATARRKKARMENAGQVFWSPSR